MLPSLGGCSVVITSQLLLLLLNMRLRYGGLESLPVITQRALHLLTPRIAGSSSNLGSTTQSHRCSCLIAQGS